ncbi:MAG: hypothetical protein ACRD0G_07140 [Acidimicrobiales bacterium]
MARLQQSGMEIDLPEGWEGTIYTRPAPPAPRDAPEDAEETRPVLHAANFALPAEVGDFGGGAVELMGHGHVFLAVVDYGPGAADSALFARRGIPRPLQTEDFDTTTLQRTLPGQSGVQRFFTEAGRGFCLYAVTGSHLLRGRVVPLINEALATLRIT